MNSKFVINFTAEEIEKRTIKQGNPPELQFIKKNFKNGENLEEVKIQYSTLLCEKISAIMPGNHIYSVKDTFKEAAKGMTVAYVVCEHSTRSSVSYQKEQLVPESDLKMTFKNKCMHCVTISESPVVIVTENETQSLGTIDPQSVSNPLFSEILKCVKKSIEDSCLSCEQSSYPLQHFDENEESFKIEMLNAWNSAVSQARTTQNAPSTAPLTDLPTFSLTATPTAQPFVPPLPPTPTPPPPPPPPMTTTPTTPRRPLDEVSTPRMAPIFSRLAMKRMALHSHDTPNPKK